MTPGATAESTDQLLNDSGFNLFVHPWQDCIWRRIRYNENNKPLDH